MPSYSIHVDLDSIRLLSLKTGAKSKFKAAYPGCNRIAEIAAKMFIFDVGLQFIMLKLLY